MHKQTNFMRAWAGKSDLVHLNYKFCTALYIMLWPWCKAQSHSVLIFDYHSDIHVAHCHKCLCHSIVYLLFSIDIITNI